VPRSELQLPPVGHHLPRQIPNGGGCQISVRSIPPATRHHWLRNDRYDETTLTLAKLVENGGDDDDVCLSFR
jgi:hypothetical protein